MLPLEIVEFIFMMYVIEDMADIFEQRRWLWFRRRRETFGAGLLNLVQAIGFDLVDDAPFAIAPNDLDRHTFSRPPGCKHQLRIGTRHVTATADYFLALKRDGGPGKFYPRADSLCVGGRSLQLDRDPSRCTLVAIDSCGAAEVVDDQIQIAVAVEISKGDGVMHAELSCTPIAGGFDELIIS